MEVEQCGAGDQHSRELTVHQFLHCVNVSFIILVLVLYEKLLKQALAYI